MTFLEFFEALIGCAEIFATDAVVKDPTTPRPSTVLTQDPSVYSMPASPSRMTSQVCTPHPSTVLAQDPYVCFMPASPSPMTGQVCTPHPSTVLAQDPSVCFMPASPSRMACWVCTPPSQPCLPLPFCHLCACLSVTVGSLGREHPVNCDGQIGEKHVSR